jgi:hypothetical protein
MRSSRFWNLTTNTPLKSRGVSENMSPTSSGSKTKPNTKPSVKPGGKLSNNLSLIKQFTRPYTKESGYSFPRLADKHLVLEQYIEDTTVTVRRYGEECVNRKETNSSYLPF